MELQFEHFDQTRNLAQQRALFNDSFPETNGFPIQRLDHYRWKFHSFPYKIHSWEYASYIAEDMVGYYAAIPYRYKIGDKIISVGMVCDVMTSPKYRGIGVFTRMGKYATGELTSQVPFTMGYPIRKEVIPGHLKVGWKIPFTLPLYIKFFRLNALLSAKKLGYIAPLANPLLSIYNFLKRTRFNNLYKWNLFSNIMDINDYNFFVQEWIESKPNALIKNLDFAIWRFSAPERKYRFLSVTNESGKMIGFVAFRNIVKEGVPSYGILDYMVLPGYEDCHGLVNMVLKSCAKEEGIEALITMMSKNSATEYLLCQNGFLKSPFVFSLIIKNLTNEFSEQELFEEKNWHLMWVDSDDL